MVKNINPTGSSNPSNLTVSNGMLYFVADDGVHGRELLQSDGTLSGTVMIQDIRPGVSGSTPRNLTDVNGTLFFTANDGITGEELWTFSILNSPLSNGVPVANISAATGAQTYYKITLPSGATNLNISTSGGTGDADLYAKAGALPTTTVFDDRSWATATNMESLAFATPPSGDWYIMLNAYDAYSGVTLVASFTIPTGSVQVNIVPAGAVSAGAQWQVGSGPFQSSGAIVNLLSVGSYTVNFKAVSGWTTPVSQTVTVNANQTTVISGTYSQIPGPAPAQMTSPANVSALGSSSVTFIWNAGSGVSRYALWVGTVPGTNNLYSAYEDGALTDTVNNLPADGRTFYVTLWSLLNGTWTPVSYEYTAVDNRTQMTGPTNGSRLTSASATFSWGASPGASNYALWVGSNPGTYDLYFKLEGGNLSDNVSNLPVDGRPIYVRLYSLINGAWVFKSYTYTAVDNRAQMSSPAGNGSAFAASSVNFTWSAGTGVTNYALWVGSSPGGNDLYGKIEGAVYADTVNNLPMDGRPIYVTLWSYLNGKWVSNYYNYTALDNKAQMTSPVNGSALGSSSVNFSWSPGAGASAYWLWVGSSPGAYDLYSKNEGASLSDTVNIPSAAINGHTIYVRLYSLINGAWAFNSYVYTALDEKAQMISPAGGNALNSTSATFNWSASPGASAYGLWVGSSPGAYDLYIKNEGGSLSDTVNNLPTDGRRIYVRLYTLTSAGWRFNAYTYDAITSSTGSPSVLTSHANGSTLASSSAAFAWNAGIGATAYALWVGNTPGGNELYSALEKNGLADTVTNVPEDGSPVYVTVWSFINGQWQNTKSRFATAVQGTSPKGLLTGASPANGSTVNSGQLTLNWSAGASTGTQYALWVGSSPGTYDVYFKLEGTSLSDTVQVPVDGRRLYVALWSNINGTWQQTNYYYDTTE